MLKPILTWWKSLMPAERRFWIRVCHVAGSIAGVMVPAMLWAGIDFSTALQLSVMPLIKDWMALHASVPAIKE